jgi:uncharacterized repeat protein (TIGR01451 family)
LPPGYILSGDPINGIWTADGTSNVSGITYNDYTALIAGPLAPGASETIQLVATIIMSDGDSKDWINYSEIQNAQDDTPIDRFDDIDSEVNSNNPAENSVLPGSPDDNNILGGGPSVGEDEDDHDPEGFAPFDLALRKRLVDSSPYLIGNTVTFQIDVINQGGVTATDVEIIDYLADGLGYLPSNFFLGWDLNVPENAALQTIASIDPGQTITLTIQYELLEADVYSTDWDNYAEISAATDATTGLPGVDVDSDPDTDVNDDDGGVPEGATDDVVTGNGTGGMDVDNPAGDEDDHDPERVPIYDLALIKEIDETETPGPYVYGDEIRFEITVCNQGNQETFGIEVSDYMPEGYSYGPSNTEAWAGPLAGPNPGENTWTLGVGSLLPEQCVTVPIYMVIEQTDGGDKDWINYGSITDMRDAAGAPVDDYDSIWGSDNPDERGVEPGDPRDDDMDSHDRGFEEDDHDPAGIEIFDLAQRKVILDNGPYDYGQPVTFTLEIFNQGSQTASDIEITDFIPCGLTLDDGSWTDNGDTASKILLGVTLAPGEMTTTTITFIVGPCPDMPDDAWTNYTEITDSFNDDEGAPGDDFDSTTDVVPDPDNDSGGVPDSSDDDNVDGDSNDGEDEDDHDPERLLVFDLALKKTMDDVGPFVYGQPITFTIEVTNQGNITATSITIQDIIPTGFSLSVNPLNAIWVPGLAPNEVQTTIDGPLLPGFSMTRKIVFDLEMTDGGEEHWVNFAQIQSAFDDSPTPVDMTGEDADSNPDSENPEELAVRPGVDPDDDITSIDKGGEEDDHDPAGPEIFDLAVYIQDNTDILANYGDDVIHNITVFNQGNTSSDGFTLTNYVPSGYVFNIGDNPGWVDNNDGTVSYTYDQVFEPGEELPLELVLEAVPSKGYDAWTNVIEISDDNPVSPGGLILVDVDSTPDAIQTNDPGGAVETDSDDTVIGDGKNGGGAPLDTDEFSDEDDQDPDIVRVFDLALRKVLLTDGPYVYGTVHDFEVCVINQGNEPMLEVGIVDYIPEGYSFNSGAGWTPGIGDTYEYTITRINPCDTLCIPISLNFEMTDGGDTDWYNYSEITAMSDTLGVDQTLNDVDSNPGSNGQDELAVIPGGPNDDNTDSTDEGGEEDDHDPAGPEVFDLAVFMLDDTDILANYGDDVTFPITVINQGNVPSDGFTLTNYVPSGYVFNIGDNPGWVDNGDGTVSYTYNEILAPEEVLPLELVLEAVPSKGEDAWTNVIEISDDNPLSPTGQVGLVDVDSTPDDTQGNDAGGAVETPSDDVVDGDGTGVPGDTNPATDEDDEDPEIVRVFDLALRKALLTEGPYTYGETHEFEVCVINQGNEPMIDVIVYDNLPDGYTYNDGLSIDWTEVDANTAQLFIPRIEPCDTLCYSIFATLEMTQGGSDAWVNYASVESMQDTLGVIQDDIDSDPGSDYPGELAVMPGGPGDDDTNSTDEGGEEDDHDPAGPDEIYDLALRKTQFTLGESFSYGDIVRYEIELFNQGNIDVTNVDVVDILPCGLDFNGGNNPGWNYDENTGEARYAWSGNLVAGTSTSVFLEVQVIPCFDENEGELWTNSAEIEGSDDDNNPGTPPLDDIDSEEDDDPTNDSGGTPDGDSDDEIDGDGTGDPEDDDADTDEDDQDPDKIEVFDLALKKRIEDRGPYFPGEIAEFVITVFNQGNVAATNIVISDTLKSGYAFPAPLNVLPLWAPELGNPSVVQHTILGVLAPGDSINIVLNLEVAVDVFAGLEQWVNHAFIESAEDTEGNVRDDDADSTPGSNRPDELAVQPDTPDDNNILGGGPSVGEDEDDHDPELIIVVGALGDRVWKDLDGDGIQDPNEPGIEGVPVTLYRCEADTIVQQMVTDSDGEYFFENLIPGDYYVQFDITGLPVGCDFTFPNQGGDDALDSDVDLTGTAPCTTIDGGERDSTWDAGLLILASLGDQVWHDLDGDGVQDPGEPGIADVEVNLYDGQGNFEGTTTTNADGQYLFDLLYPGDYYVEFITPDGFELTFPNQGANDNLDSDVDGSQGPGTTTITNLTPGENDLSWDAGYYICSPVGDLVWYDTNENDVQDPAENGINGLRVNLWKFHFGEWIIWDFQYTGHKPGTPSDDGYFKFCAPPGQYYLEFELPPYGLVPAQAFAGGDDTKDSDVNNANGFQTTPSFPVLSAEMWCDYDAGYYPMASVGDQVWRDDNGNGLQDLNEGPVQGVRVEAFDQNNDLIGTTYTDEDGEYMVDYLQKEGYYLRFSPDGSFGFTIPNVGDDTMDSDVNHANGPNTTGFYMMSPGVHIPNIDAGIVFGVVPIQLLDFTGQYKADYNYLEWTTETELNSDYFELERRFEKEKSFREIAKVAAAGVSQSRLGYNFGDYDIPSEGIYYYRLKQYDRDGKFEYSNVIGIEVNRPTTNSIALYPNPSTGITSLDINVSKEDNVNVSIYDVHGKLIKANLISEELSAGAHQKVLDLTDMPAGVYTISVKIGNTLTNKKLIRLKN